MSEQMTAAISLAVGLPIMWLFIRGLAATCDDIWGDWGARLKWKRERQPLSVRDQAVEAIAEDMVKNPDNWVSVTDDSNKYFGVRETLRRADKRITISGYTMEGLNGLQIDIDGLGRFNAKQIKPTLAKALHGICLAHKDYLALGVVLSPDKFILTER